MEKVVQVIKATKGINKKIRVGAYCRVSSDKDDNINSFFAQMQYYNDYIKTNSNMEFVDIYADEGITGTELSKRSEMKRLISDCKNKKLDRVLVKSVTRFARNSLECIEIVRIMASCGVTVFFENDNLDTATMNTEMTLYIKSAFAQCEALSASKRMKTSIRMRMEDGTYYNTARPFGYKWENRQLVIVPEEAEVVRNIFNLYLSGKSAIDIFNELKKKMKFSLNTVKYILTNEKYVGDTLWQKSYTPDILPLRKKENKGQVAKYLYQNSHEGIITREIFELAQELRSNRKRIHYTGNKIENLTFSKKIKCRHCGWVFRYKVINGDDVWCCSKKDQWGKVCSSRLYRNNEVEKAFLIFFNRLKQNSKYIIDDTLLFLQNAKRKLNTYNEEIKEIDEQIALLSNENALYNQMYDSNMIDDVMFREKTNIIKEELLNCRFRRQKLLDVNDDEKSMEKVREFKRIIDDYDIQIKFNENLFRNIINYIYAEENGDLTFETKCGFEFTIKDEEI